MNISYSILRAVERVHVAKCEMERQNQCPSKAGTRGGRRQQTRGGDSVADTMVLPCQFCDFFLSVIAWSSVIECEVL